VDELLHVLERVRLGVPDAQAVERASASDFTRIEPPAVTIVKYSNPISGFEPAMNSTFAPRRLAIAWKTVGKTVQLQPLPFLPMIDISTARSPASSSG
jgi:hypothetical protein